MLPAQMLWVNQLTTACLGSRWAASPPTRVPCAACPPAESVLGAGLWQRIARIGVIIAAVTLAVAGTLTNPALPAADPGRDARQS